ncbi:YfhO family protein, partial [Lacticaseibacillus paracasei]
LTLGSQFADHLVTLNQNGQTVTLPDSFNDTITVNVTPRNPKAEQVLRFRLNKKDAWFENFDLYQADAKQVIHDLKKLQTGSWHVIQHTATTVEATINILHDHQM